MRWRVAFAAIFAQNAFRLLLACVGAYDHDRVAALELLHACADIFLTDTHGL